MYIMDCIPNTEALEKCTKRCLKCHLVHMEIYSKLLQPSGIHCVQPACYLEVGSAQAYMKLNEVSAECMTDRSFPRGQTLLVIFHSRTPPRVISLMMVACLVHNCSLGARRIEEVMTINTEQTWSLVHLVCIKMDISSTRLCYLWIIS